MLRIRIAMLFVSLFVASTASLLAQTREPSKKGAGRVATAEEPDFTRFRVVTDQGILAVFDADEDWDGRDEPYSQLAYWHDFATEQFFFFDQLLFNEADVLQSIAAMQRDLDIDLAPILAEKPEFDPIPEEVSSPGSWLPAGEVFVLAVMSGGAAATEGEVSGLISPCAPNPNCDPAGAAAAASGPIAAPIRGTSRSELFASAQAVTYCDCDGGGGTPQPSPTYCPGDKDCDGIPNGSDPDVDGDGNPSGSDPDVDGDGTPNGSDSDVDGDGLPNGIDPDIDGDGTPNGSDSDMDGDGISNAADDDMDGDGTPNWDDPDSDGCDGPCCGSTDSCCGVTDPCARPPCGNPCQCLDCDDGKDCTGDGCTPSYGCSHTCSGTADVGLTADGCGPPFSVEVEEITFRGNSPIYRDWLPWGWGVSTLFADPDWTSDGNNNNPVCYSKSRTMTIDVKIRVTGEAASTTGELYVEGPNGVHGTGYFTVPCGEASKTVTIRTTQLPDCIRHYEPMELQWSARPDENSGFSYITSTFHDTYITYSSPSGSHATQKRLHWLCENAFAFGTEATIVPNIHYALRGDPPFDTLNPFVTDVVDHWWIMAGLPYGGECDEQARFLVLAFRLLGLTGASWYNTWPSPRLALADGSILNDCDPSQPVTMTAHDAGITWDIDGDTVIGNEALLLRFDFAGGSGGAINAFEGSVAYPSIGKYYAVWPSLAANSKCELLLQVRDHTLADTGRIVVQCWALATNPWQCIINPSTGELVQVNYPVCSPGCP